MQDILMGGRNFTLYLIIMGEWNGKEKSSILYTTVVK